MSQYLANVISHYDTSPLFVVQAAAADVNDEYRLQIYCSYDCPFSVGFRIENDVGYAPNMGMHIRGFK